MMNQRSIQKPSILLIIPHYGKTNSKISQTQEKNVEGYYDYPFPLGIPYIAAALSAAGYQYTPLNLNYADDSDGVLRQELQQHYDYVMTGGNSLIFKQISRMTRLIRETSPDSIIVLGGPVITTEPELMMECMDFDYGVIGEGEVTIIRLLDALENKLPPDSVKGIVFRNPAGKVIRTEAGEIQENLDKLPFPELDAFGYRQWLDHVLSSTSYSFSYFDEPRPYVILGSRGCPFNCTFCFHDQKNRARSLEDLFEEIEFAVKKYNVNLIQVNDDCFAVKSERVYGFCDKMQDLRRRFKRDIQWTVQLTVKHVTPELLRRMKESGCNSISYGFESFSPVVLKSMHKPITPEEIDYAFKQTVKAGITVQANFIFGDPAETPETYMETLRYWRKNCQGQINLFIVAAYPGSKIFEYCIQKGIIKDKKDYIENHLGSPLNMTAMTNDEYLTMHRDIQLHSFLYHKYFIIFHRKPPFFHFYCPYCRHRLNSNNMAEIKTPLFVYTCKHCAKQFYIVHYKRYFRYFLTLAKVIFLRNSSYRHLKD